MSKFKIGEKVICLINSMPKSSQFRKKDEIVTVTGIQECPYCNTISINVNNRKAIDKPCSGTSRCICEQSHPHGGLGWTMEKCFAPFKSNTETKKESISEELKLALADENYELAAQLRDNLI